MSSPAPFSHGDIRGGAAGFNMINTYFTIWDMDEGRGRAVSMTFTRWEITTSRICVNTRTLPAVRDLTGPYTLSYGTVAIWYRNRSHYRQSSRYYHVTHPKMLIHYLLGWQRHSVHRGSPGSIPGHVTWDLWWAKWHRGGLIPFGFPCQF
jgi:hypothetical protein